MRVQRRRLGLLASLLPVAWAARPASAASAARPWQRHERQALRCRSGAWPDAVVQAVAGAGSATPDGWRAEVWVSGGDGAAAELPCAWGSDLAAEPVELLAQVSDVWGPRPDRPDPLAWLGAVSRWSGLRYWSASERARVVLVREAWAVQGSAGDRRRGDYSLDELRSGQWLGLRQRDNRSSGAALYAMQGQALPRGGLALRVVNREALRWLGFTLAEPGELQLLQWLQPLPDGRWAGGVQWVQRRLRLGSRDQHAISSLNRAVAWLDAMAGRDTRLADEATPGR